METEQIIKLVVKGVPLLVLVALLVARRRGVDVDAPERTRVAGVSERFLEAPRAEIRGERLVGTPASVHVILIALFVGGLAALEWWKVPRDALGHGFAALFTLGPAALVLWSLLAIERVTLSRDRLTYANRLGRSRTVRFEDVNAAILRITPVVSRGQARATYMLVLGTEEDWLELSLGEKDALAVGALFDPEIRHIEDLFEVERPVPGGSARG